MSLGGSTAVYKKTKSLSSTFDYHLTSSEKEQVKKAVPKSQTRIHISFKASIEADDKKIENGAVALGDNKIYLFQRAIFGKALKKFSEFHLLSIKEFRVETKDYCVFTLDKNRVAIASTIVIKFAQKIIKNYIYSVPLIPPVKRFNFFSYDFTLFKKVDPGFSPCQAFQNTYDSFCCFYDVPYVHEIVNYFDQLILNNNPFFDFCEIPMRFMELYNDVPLLDIKPLMATLRYCPFTFGIMCDGMERPDILLSVAKVIASNSLVNVLKLTNCGVTEGVPEIARVLEKSSSQNVKYWDLSGNKLENPVPFFQSLGSSNANITVLKFENCGFHDSALAALFGVIADNVGYQGSLRSLKQLCVAGNQCGTLATAAFLKMISTMNKEDMKNMKTVTIGPMQAPVPVIKALRESKHKLYTLKILDSKFPENTSNELIKFVGDRGVREFELNECDLATTKIVEIIDVISANSKISQIKLGFNKMKIAGDRMKEIMGAIQRLGAKLIGLKMDDNHTTGKDLNSFIRGLNHSSNLMYLSFSGNLEHGESHISTKLLCFLSLPSLISLELRGTKSCSLKDDIIPFLCAMQTNRTIQILDISGQRIGSFGLEVLTNLVMTNRTLRRIKIGNTGAKYQKIRKFLKAVYNNTNLIDVPFPVNDFADILKNREESLKRIKLAMRLHYVMTKKFFKNRSDQKVSGFSLYGDQDLNKIGKTSAKTMDQLINYGDEEEDLESVSDIFDLPDPSDEHPSDSKPFYNHAKLNEAKFVEEKNFIPIDDALSDLESFEASESSTSETSKKSIGGFTFDIPEEIEGAVTLEDPKQPADESRHEEDEDSMQFDFRINSGSAVKAVDGFTFAYDDEPSESSELYTPSSAQSIQFLHVFDPAKADNGGEAIVEPDEVEELKIEPPQKAEPGDDINEAMKNELILREERKEEEELREEPKEISIAPVA